MLWYASPWEVYKTSVHSSDCSGLLTQIINYLNTDTTHVQQSAKRVKSFCPRQGYTFKHHLSLAGGLGVHDMKQDYPLKRRPLPTSGSEYKSKNTGFYFGIHHVIHSALFYFILFHEKDVSWTNSANTNQKKQIQWGQPVLAVTVTQHIKKWNNCK